jgi:elongation factor Ts
MSDALKQIKEIRARSGVGLDACRLALEESGGNVDAALEILKRKGILKAADRAGRIATEGRLFTYIHRNGATLHGGGSKVSVVEINCETDFSAKSDAFLEFGDHVALQVMASAPLALNEADLEPVVVASQIRVCIDQLPVAWSEEERLKILEDKFKKWVAEVCLLNQDSVKEPGKTIEQLRTELVAKLGENVTIRRFVRWEVGEGL